MKADLDTLLEALRRRPEAARLDQFEPQVWARIEAARRAPAPQGVWSWRAGLAAAMLGLGAFAGGAAAASSATDTSPFALNSAYAPSTLLELGR